MYHEVTKNGLEFFLNTRSCEQILLSCCEQVDRLREQGHDFLKHEST